MNINLNFCILLRHLAVAKISSLILKIKNRFARPVTVDESDRKLVCDGFGGNATGERADLLTFQTRLFLDRSTVNMDHALRVIVKTSPLTSRPGTDFLV